MLGTPTIFSIFLKKNLFLFGVQIFENKTLDTFSGSERRASDHHVINPTVPSQANDVQVGLIEFEWAVNVRVVNQSVENTNRVGVVNIFCVDMDSTNLKQVQNIILQSGPERINERSAVAVFKLSH